MSFTDRFIRLPIKQYNAKEEKLTGRKEFEDTYIKINPFEISEYKPTIDDECDDVDCVSVTMKNGNNFYAYLSIKEFENLLNKCHTA